MWEAFGQLKARVDVPDSLHIVRNVFPWYHRARSRARSRRTASSLSMPLVGFREHGRRNLVSWICADTVETGDAKDHHLSNRRQRAFKDGKHLFVRDRRVWQCEIQKCFGSSRHAVTAIAVADAVARQITHLVSRPECRGRYARYSGSQPSPFIAAQRASSPDYTSFLFRREMKYARKIPS